MDKAGEAGGSRQPVHACIHGGTSTEGGCYSSVSMDQPRDIETETETNSNVDNNSRSNSNSNNNSNNRDEMMLLMTNARLSVT